MSQTSNLQQDPVIPQQHQPFLQHGTSKEEEDFAQEASRISLELIGNGINNNNPVTPSLTKGHIIMPPLNNETIKYVCGYPVGSWVVGCVLIFVF